MNLSSNLRTNGKLNVKVIKAPIAPLSWRIKNIFRFNYLKSLFGVFVIVPIAKFFGIMTGYGQLKVVHIRSNGSRINYGTVGYRMITNAMVQFITDQLQTETAVFGDFKFHDSGVGVVAEAVTDTDMGTTDGESRVTGTQTEADADSYQSVGTITYTTTKAITEHGLFNASTVGTLMDRTVFAAINVGSGDSIQFTYQFNLTAGG